LLKADVEAFYVVRTSGDDMASRDRSLEASEVRKSIVIMTSADIFDL
jgi:hypothetical protein